MKNEKGVTLVSLVVTIILVLVLSTIGLSASLSAYRNMKMENFIAKMKVIQEKVNTIRDNYKNWEGYDPTKEQDEGYYKTELGFVKATEATPDKEGTFKYIIEAICDYYGVEDKTNATEILQKVPSCQYSDAYYANYYYFSSDDIENKLGIKNMEDISIFVNFATGNVIELNGVAEPGNTSVKIYRLYDYGTKNQLITETKNEGAMTINSEIVKNFGLSKTVKISLISNKTTTKEDGTTEVTIAQNDEIPLINKVYYKVANSLDGTGNLIWPDNWSDTSQLGDYEIKDNEIYFNVNISGKYIFKVTTYNKETYEQKVDVASAIDESIDIKLCNPPVLVEGMTPVYWDETKEVSTQLTEISDVNSPLWYDYSATKNKWANVQTEDGSLWVWIPRYAVDNTTTPTEYQFLVGVSNTTTNGLKTYDEELVQKAFSENGDVTGIWVAKFQGKYDSTNNITTFKPGESLDTATVINAKSYCKNTIIDSVKLYSRLMSDNAKKAITDLTSILGISISTSSNSSYAGGGSTQYAYVSKGTESSTSNTYGVYDLKSGIEITTNSLQTDEGRYRSIAYSTAIDLNNPTVSVSQTNIDYFSLAVQVSASDKESGLGINPTYNYYIKPSSQANYPTTPTISTQSTNYTFTGLTHNTNYDVKVTATDIEGNIGTGYALNIKTNKYITIQYLKDTQETVEENTTLGDGKGGEIVIPIGCTVAPDSSIYVSEGVVIITPDGSEWVWVPVTDSSKMYGIDSSGNKRGKLYNFSALTHSARNWTETNGIITYTTATSYREPSLVTGNSADTSAILETISGTNYDASSSYYGSILGYSSAKAFGEQMQNDFDEMIASVEKYGGFYVGRYETSLNSSGIAQSKQGVESIHVERTDTYRWYGLYKVQKNYAANNGWTAFIGSNMIWGCQYDQMMIWMQSASLYVNKKNPFNLDSSIEWYNKTTTARSNENDKFNNVYDLMGSRREITMEANNTSSRTMRGGDNGSTYSTAAYIADQEITNTSSFRGSRMTFYLK